PLAALDAGDGHLLGDLPGGPVVVAAPDVGDPLVRVGPVGFANAQHFMTARHCDSPRLSKWAGQIPLTGMPLILQRPCRNPPEVSNGRHHADGGTRRTEYIPASRDASVFARMDCAVGGS